MLNRCCLILLHLRGGAIRYSPRATTATAAVGGRRAISGIRSSINSENNGAGNHEQQQQRRRRHHDDDDESKTKEDGKTIHWIVKPATPQDEDRVRTLLTETYTKVMPLYYSSAILEKAMPVICEPQPELLQSGTWYIVEQPNTYRLVGCGGWLQHEPENDKGDATTTPLAQTVSDVSNRDAIAHLRHFATHPDYIGQGIGKAIWQRTLQDIQQQQQQVHQTTTTKTAIITSGKDNNAPIPKLEVFSSINAVDFYRSLGFKCVDSVELPFDDGCLFPVVVMRNF